MPGAEWFPRRELSYAEHIFRGKPDDRVAIVHASELRPQARADVGRAAGARPRRSPPACASSASGRGDRVVGLPAEHPRGGGRVPRLRLDRRDLVELLARLRRAQRHRPASPRSSRRCCSPSTATATAAATSTASTSSPRSSEAIPSLEHTFVLPYLDAAGDGRLPRRLPGTSCASRAPAPSSSSRSCRSTIRSGCSTRPARPGCRRRSSTARAAILLEYLKKLHLHVDAQPGDRLFWFTTTGWMMWNYLLGALLTDAAIVLYDGNPAAPDPDVLWDLAASAGVTCFGTSAAYIAACMQERRRAGARARPRRRCAASARPARRSRPRASAGSTTTSGADTWLFSMSGGTDVATAFVGGVPTLPVYEGELQARVARREGRGVRRGRTARSSTRSASSS